ncbi:hypothetical protein ACP275_04G150700 [Erythranthe tilingii]
MNKSTSRSPFEIVIGQQPLTRHAMTTSVESERSPGDVKMVKTWEEHADLARSYAEKARRDFAVDNRVMVKLLPQQFKSLRGMHRGLIRRYEGPFPVVAKIGKVSYRLDLPSTLKIHHVFHVSMLKPYHVDERDPSRGYSHRAPPVVTKSYDKEIESVLERRVIRGQGV